MHHRAAHRIVASRHVTTAPTAVDAPCPWPRPEVRRRRLRRGPYGSLGPPSGTRRRSSRKEAAPWSALAVGARMPNPARACGCLLARHRGAVRGNAVRHGLFPLRSKPLPPLNSAGPSSPYVRRRRTAASRNPRRGLEETTSRLRVTTRRPVLADRDREHAHGGIRAAVGGSTRSGRRDAPRPERQQPASSVCDGAAHLELFRSRSGCLLGSRPRPVRPSFCVRRGLKAPRPWESILWRPPPLGDRSRSLSTGQRTRRRLLRQAG